jgi:hypothetical protein
MLPSYSKRTDTKNTIEIPIDSVKIMYEQQLINKIKEKINVKNDFSIIKGTLQIYAVRYFAIDAEKNDFSLEQKILDAITQAVKELKDGTKEK